MEHINEDRKQAYIDAASKLKGGHRRQFMARIVNSLGRGGATWAERELGWDRKTILKGQRELEAGMPPMNHPGGSGRPRAEEHLPDLLEDIKAIVDAQSQTDPTFKSTRLYTRLSARAVRQALIDQGGYTDEELPTQETIRVKLNELGYRLRAVQKSKPKKKIPETDAIFEHLSLVHDTSAQDARTLRISLDAKATIKLGEFSRGGNSRIITKALDHDFLTIEGKVHLLGFYLPEWGETYFFFLPYTTSLTADTIVDCLELLLKDLGDFMGCIDKILLNLDNGPENNSRRRQFIKRLIDFADEWGKVVELAYYPPYHSKYNPIERVWGVLEQHWNGTLLTDLKTVLAMAKSMTYRGVEPVVNVVKKTYNLGVTLCNQAMKVVEKRLYRQEGLENYAVTITPLPSI
jgi:hypothetical protein